MICDGRLTRSSAVWLCTSLDKNKENQDKHVQDNAAVLCYRSSTLRYHQATSSTSYDARSHPAQSHHAADIQHQLYKAISEAKAFTGLRNALRTIGTRQTKTDTSRTTRPSCATGVARSATTRQPGAPAVTQEVARPTPSRVITRLTYSISFTRRYPKLKPSQAYIDNALRTLPKPCVDLGLLYKMYRATRRHRNRQDQNKT